jgi:branched-chain amino acid transport system ATP-binding protein
VKRGLSHVPEGRMIFANLTVLENLQMGAYLQCGQKSPSGANWNLFSPRFRACRSAAADCRDAEWRRAADAGDWPGLDGRPKFLMLDEFK